MAEGKKRAAVKARKANTPAAKGSRRRQRCGSGVLSRRAYGARAVTRSAGQGISITVQIPPLRRPKDALKKNSAVPAASNGRRVLRPILSVPIIALVALVVYYGGFQDTHEKTTPTTQAAATVRKAPNFQPLVPSAEKASSTKYDGKRNMVSYTTDFSGSRVTVSQQGLPETFKKDPAALMKAADSIRAKQRIPTDKGELFVASNDTGDQMAVFADAQVLVFVHTDKKLDDISWKSFVDLLTAKSWEELI